MKRSIGAAVASNDAVTPRRCLLVSLRPRHARDILSGIKTFKFRRVTPRLVSGDEVVIYATAPAAAIVGRFQVSTVLSRAPESLWRQVSAGPGLSRAEFCEYFRGSEIAHAIGIGRVDVLRVPLTLATIRKELTTFMPPQSYWYLDTARAADAIMARQLAIAFARTAGSRRAS